MVKKKVSILTFTGTAGIFTLQLVAPTIITTDTYTSATVLNIFKIIFYNIFMTS